MKQVIINLEENSGVRCGDSHVIVTRAGTESNRNLASTLAALAAEYRHPKTPSPSSGATETPSTAESTNQISATGLPSR